MNIIVQFAGDQTRIFGNDLKWKYESSIEKFRVIRNLRSNKGIEDIRSRVHFLVTSPPLLRRHAPGGGCPSHGRRTPCGWPAGGGGHQHREGWRPCQRTRHTCRRGRVCIGRGLWRSHRHPKAVLQRINLLAYFFDSRNRSNAPNPSNASDVRQ